MDMAIKFFLERWDFFVTFFTLLLVAWRIGRKTELLVNQVKQSLESIRTLMVSNNFIVGALVEQKILSADKLLEIMIPYRSLSQSAIDKLIQAIKPSGNPITRAEADRLTELLKIAIEQQELDYDRALEFYKLAQKIANDKPSELAFQQLFDFSAFILGKASSTVSA